MTPEIQSLYKLWLDRLDSADPMYEELASIEGNEAAITDRFYQEIVFGTAGLAASAAQEPTA